MTDIIQLLQSGYGQFSKTQKKVADYIFKYPLQVSFSTIDQLAHIVGVSTTSIVRLTTVLGFSGYSDFQRCLQEYLKNKTSPSIKLEAKQKSHKKLNDSIDDIISQQMANIQTTCNNITEESITSAVQALLTARHIYTLGMRSSFCIAHYLNYNLNRMFGKSSLIAAEGGEEYEDFINIEKDSVLIAISMPRYIREVSLGCQAAKERGAKVIVITDEFSSPLSASADILFCVEVNSLGFHNSMLSSMMVAELLVESLTEKCQDEIKARLQETEKVLHALNVHINK